MSHEGQRLRVAGLFALDQERLSWRAIANLIEVEPLGAHRADQAIGFRFSRGPMDFLLRAGATSLYLNEYVFLVVENRLQKVGCVGPLFVGNVVVFGSLEPLLDLAI